MMSQYQLSTLTTWFILSLQALATPAIAQITPANPLQTSAYSTQISSETAYILGAGDVLKIDLFNIPEYSGQYLVLVDGTISTPVIGSIKVAGMTIAELTATMSQQYGNYVKRPIVSVSLVSPRPLKISVAGEISRPGTYTVGLIEGQKFPTVSEVIQLAGGTTASANVRQVQVQRFFQGRQQAINVNLFELLQGNLGQDITLRDGDTILIPTSAEINPKDSLALSIASFGINTRQTINVAVIGEVNRPGSYDVKPFDSSNVGSQPPRLTQAVQLAGGIKPLADIRKIEVRRLTREGKTQSIEINLWELLAKGDIEQDVILQEGDTIIIPTATELTAEESQYLAEANFSPATININVVGEVKKPGTMALPPNTPLNQALLAAGDFNKSRARQNKVELVRLNPNGTVTKREINIDFAAGINEENNPILLNDDVVIVNRNAITAVADKLDVILRPIGSFFSIFNFFNIFW